MESCIKYLVFESKYYGVYDTCSLKVPERYEGCLRVSSSVKEKSLSTPPSGGEWANVGRDRMNLGIRVFPIQSSNGLLGGT